MTATITKTATKIHITKEQERKLIEQYQKNGDNDALLELIEAHNPYVQQLVGKAYKTFNKMLEFEDLLQQAKLGLIKAATQFNLDKTITDENSPNYGQHFRFLTYAHQKIIAQMQEAWHHAHAAHIPAHTIRAIQFKKLSDNYTPKVKARIKQATLAMRGESYDAMIEDFKNNKESRSSNSFEIQFNENGVQVQDPTFEESTKNMFSSTVEKAIKKLTKNEWEIFKLKIGMEGIKYRFPEIAEQLNLPIEEVDKSYKKAKRILARHIDLEKAI